MNTRLASYRDGEIELAFPINGAHVTIGREDDNEIQLPHEKVSKHHAALVPSEAGWCIVDLGSANGVWVNGKQVQRVVLKQGDRVSIGSYELVFETNVPAEEWVPSYLMDLSPKVHEQTIFVTKPPPQG